MSNNIKHNGFKTYEHSRTTRYNYPSKYKKSHRKLDPHFGFDASSMFLKLAICAGVAGLVLVLSWMQSPVTDPSVQAATHQEDGTENNDDNPLGKLQFVELPGIIEVFSSSAKLRMPIESQETNIENDGYTISLVAGMGQKIDSCIDGVVKEVVLNGNAGESVTIVSDTGIEIVFSGISEVLVEAGQPISQNDHIGIIEGGEALSLTAFLKGEPQEIKNVFDINEGEL